jgi:hypothetical protein
MIEVLKSERIVIELKSSFFKTLLVDSHFRS